MSVLQEGVNYRLTLQDLFTSKINKANKDANRLNDTVAKTQMQFNKLGSALGVSVGIAGVVSFGQAVIESLKNYEYFSSSLRVLMKGDALSAKALETQLISTAAKTPFALNELQDATKQLLAYGFAAGDVIKNIKMLGDVASALKIPFQDIAYLYGTLKTQGRAFSKDIYQFTGRGIPIVKELAKQFKVADSEVMKLVEDGKVGFKDIEKAFRSMTNEGGMFFDMMSIQSQTLGGRLSNLSDSWEQLKVNIGKSQSGILSGTVTWVEQMLSAVTKVTGRGNQFEENMSKFGGEDYSTFQKFKDMINPLPSLGGGQRQLDYQSARQFNDAIYTLYVDEPLKSLHDGYKRKQELFNLLSNQSKAFLKGEIDLVTKNRNRATLLGALEGVSGQIGLFGKKEGGANSQNSTSATSAAKGGTSTNIVETKGHQNFNIDIGNLIERFEINTTNLKDSAASIKEEVTKALIGAVNDFQLMATK